MEYGRRDAGYIIRKSKIHSAGCIEAISIDEILKEFGLDDIEIQRK